jgi:hypothetical protein
MIRYLWRAILLFTLFPLSLFAQRSALPDIPSVYANMSVERGRLLLTFRDGTKLFERERPAPFTLQSLSGSPQATEKGIAFQFGAGFEGELHYGFIPYGDSKHPMPVYFRAPTRIENGKAEINIAGPLSGIYDMVDWQRRGKGVIGYRVISMRGIMLHDGIVGFRYRDNTFSIAPAVIEGPFINKLGPDSLAISFSTSMPATARLLLDGRQFDSPAGTRHEIDIKGLNPAVDYPYTLLLDQDTVNTYHFRTAPPAGSRKPFTFAYASDSRSGQGGGERDLYGANFYIMKKIAALTKLRRAVFLQFTGDLVDGYVTDPDEINLQYANWKRSVQPFWHYFPIYTAMGNHELLMRVFSNDRLTFSVNRFPFDSESSEAVFADNFVNPENGPDSEDGAAYDPNPNAVDFPTYKENVYYHVYDNLAMIVLNSNYLYVINAYEARATGGNIHGYVLDNQLAWLEKTVAQLEADERIDHIMVTIHTPFFPNGGHVRDDMWYGGNNQIRPYIAGRPHPKGIIERRDELLDILVNRSQKTRAILTGDEHNYNRLLLTPKTQIYPDEPYFYPKIELSRDIYQINNGAAGAPYYAQEETPWTPYVSAFTTQHALVFFHVNGLDIEVEVVNPDTLEEVDRFKLN